MSEWKYNLRWRTNFEGLELLGWTAGIAATIGVNTLLICHHCPAIFLLPYKPRMAYVVSLRHGIYTLISVDSNANLNRSSWT